jgi:uncharacterized protein (DUF2062 family)
MGRIAGYRTRVRAKLRAAFAEDHPPHLIAVSFAVGVFVTALPSLGTGLFVLAWVGYQFAWANRLALLAAVAVLNPLAKSSVYAASFLTGTVLLGPIPGVSRADLGLDAGIDVLVRLLVGNAVVAVVLAVVGYVVAHRAVCAMRRTGS